VALRLATALLLPVVLGACSTYAAQRYSVNADTVVALRQFAGHAVSVGAFTSTPPGENVITCRAVGPIKTPDGEPFSEFVRKALVAEMKIAGIYADNAATVLTGSLDAIDFSTMSGNWRLSLTLVSSNGHSLSQTENYSFSSSYVGETACNQTAQALMPAVQDLIARTVNDPAFRTLIGA
jgi:hypothetical protein